MVYVYLVLPSPSMDSGTCRTPAQIVRPTYPQNNVPTTRRNKPWITIHYINTKSITSIQNSNTICRQFLKIQMKTQMLSKILKTSNKIQITPKHWYYLISSVKPLIVPPTSINYLQLNNIKTYVGNQWWLSVSQLTRIQNTSTDSSIWIDTNQI